MKKDFKIILLVFFVGFSAFSIFKYIALLKERQDLFSSLNKIKAEAAALEHQKQELVETVEKERQLQGELNDENLALKESLKENEERLAKLDADFNQAKETITQIESEIGSLKTQALALNEERDNLNTQLMAVTQERNNLKMKLSSTAELKKAIRELRKQVRKVSHDIEQKSKVAATESSEGNQGFLVKDGKSTYPASVRIEVIPASLLENP